jgi:hypothetical protein
MCFTSGLIPALPIVKLLLAGMAQPLAPLFLMRSPPPNRRQLGRFLAVLLRSPGAKLGALILLVLVGVALFAPRSPPLIRSR